MLNIYDYIWEMGKGINKYFLMQIQIKGSDGPFQGYKMNWEPVKYVTSHILIIFFFYI